jgi:hypothetical protein
VHIIESLAETLLNQLQKLYAADFIIVENGKELNVKKSPKDLCLKDQAQLVVFGFSTVSIKNIASKRGSLNWFCRFRDTKNDGWYIGRDRWDAVIFTVKRSIRVYGCGIFGPYNNSSGACDFKFGYKYIIKEGDSELVTSSVFEEDVVCPPDAELENHIIKYSFVRNQDGIKVRAG